ncbi:MAG: hypothetical protein K2W96_11960, partial [Gemmataceae bacterium]|nr:hypothetical protein [Gemmataceae bacterium]
MARSDRPRARRDDEDDRPRRRRPRDDDEDRPRQRGKAGTRGPLLWILGVGGGLAAILVAVLVVMIVRGRAPVADKAPGDKPPADE